MKSVLSDIFVTVSNAQYLRKMFVKKHATKQIKFLFKRQLIILDVKCVNVNVHLKTVRQYVLKIPIG